MQFFNCLKDNFFTQHVNFCTRNDAVLDLVISDEPNAVQSVTDLGPFATASGDHSALSWNLEVRTRYEVVHKQILDYSKADIAAIKSELGVIDWNVLFANQSADVCWEIFKKKIERLEAKFIPVKWCCSSRKKPLWMTHRACKAVKMSSV